MGDEDKAGAAEANDSERVEQCPFYDIGDKNLQIAHVLLYNLLERMSRGLKNQTTSKERDALHISIKVIERELKWRDGSPHGCLGNATPQPAKEER